MLNVNKHHRVKQTKKGFVFLSALLTAPVSPAAAASPQQNSNAENNFEFHLLTHIIYSLAVGTGMCMNCYTNFLIYSELEGCFSFLLSLPLHPRFGRNELQAQPSHASWRTSKIEFGKQEQKGISKLCFWEYAAGVKRVIKGLPFLGNAEEPDIFYQNTTLSWPHAKKNCKVEI